MKKMMSATVYLEFNLDSNVHLEEAFAALMNVKIEGTGLTITGFQIEDLEEVTDE